MPRRLITGLIFSLSFIICCVAAPAPFATIAEVSAQPSVPYDLGNWTYVRKPVFPLKINASQIPTGANWTYVYTLNENHTYHMYCYGEWIDYDPDSAKTDYDIFVYNPLGELESYHTEAAGLPEHLGTTVDQPLFTPKHTGNYSFLIKNDPRESQGAKEATFMLIEHVECNKWYQRYIEGKVNDKPIQNTSWAYEFNTTSKHVEVWIEVPDALDMYEARLYIMANPSKGMGFFLNDMPLAWEPGLYGDLSGLYGGYNLDSRGFRHTETLASCEFPGQDMLINYTCPYEGNFLYHLVLIAEHGNGSLNFMVKTDFEAPKLGIQDPIEEAYSGNETSITVYVDEKHGLEKVLLNYTGDDWATWVSIEMSASQNQTYVGTIPKQPAGTTVKYRILAYDNAGNNAEVGGSYVVKNPTNITCTLSKSVIHYGENITLTGSISHGGATVTLNYTCGDAVTSKLLSTDSKGFFNDMYIPNKTGSWAVLVSWPGNESCFGASSGYGNFTVEKTLMSITCNTSKAEITVGENIAVIGLVYPIVENLTVTLEFTMPNGSAIKQYAYTSLNGTFTVSFQPNSTGSWYVQAKLDGDDLRCGSHSKLKPFRVSEAWIDQYKTHIILSVAAVIAISVAAVFIRRRRYG
ncbi:hypothetical protein GWO13_11315 [Candidatus Bathyarchaeota archaeon]|nr:hypothetical protein [Candidatus Bathyarchaeota archaeon]